jgi:hypothetical protein
MKTTKQTPTTTLPKRQLEPAWKGMVQSSQDPPPCSIHQGWRTAPTSFEVDVTKPASEWKVSLAPIPLENDGDTVVWNLSEVFAYFSSSNKTIQDVRIKFSKGPAGFLPDSGPFTSPPLFDINAMTLTATGRNHLYGSCYCYDILVEFTVSPTGAITLFPTDPEIDNLAPPPPPPRPPKGNQP